MSTRSPQKGTPSASSQSPLALTLGERAVGTHDALPGHTGIVDGMQHRAGVARRLRAEVRVGRHVPARHGPRALEHRPRARRVGVYRASKGQGRFILTMTLRSSRAPRAARLPW